MEKEVLSGISRSCAVKKIIFPIVLVTFFLAFVSARPAYAATRYLDSMFTSVKTTTNVSYKQGLLLDIYEPEGDTESKRAAIIWIHGGGFSSGNKEQFADGGVRGFASDYVRRGYVSIPINYRLVREAVSVNSPTANRAIQMAKEDALSAVRWVADHASTYRVDPNRIIVGGFSAGAVTALYAAYDTTASDQKVAAAVSFSGGMLNVSSIQSGEPPAILIHGEKDTIVPLSLASSVSDRLTALGIKNELHTYPVGHPTSDIAEAHTKVRAFLAKILAPKYVADLDGNGSVNVIDFTLLMNYWFWGSVNKIDFNNDGKISVIDYTIFMNSWYDFSRR